MEKILKKYVDSKSRLLKSFDCNGEYFVKPLEGYNWRVKELDQMAFLTYWKEGEKLNECVIVKKNNAPIIVRRKDYTMIVAIECVKVALILKNDMEV